MDEATTLGPLCTENALALVLQQIETAIKGGAKVLLGGKRIERPGYYLEPTIITDITPENPAFYEEFFAPVALMFRIPDDAAAIALAIMTTDIERGKRIAREIQSGMVFINAPTWTAPDLPFGGIKSSGYGRELSELGIGEFLNKKLIRVA
jgi:succinate-semialdehyde dehydrogenase/glutarate-semialdehyde dehydrogenase